MMSWDVTCLLVDLMAAFGVAKLVRHAACWMERLAVVGWACSMLVMATAFALRINSVDGYIYFIWLAFTVGHLATMLYIFQRIHLEYLCLPNGLRRSPNS